MTDRKRPSPDGRCVAKSKKSGERCKRRAMVGGRVCAVHGGSAPQVKRAAAERLAEARDDALALLALQIGKTIECIDKNKPQLVGYVEPTVAVRAVKELTELVETLEGRVATRQEVVGDASEARAALAQLLARRSERNRAGDDPSETD